MKRIDLAEETFYFVDIQPDWSSPVTMLVGVPSYADQGWDGKESRRAMGEALTLSRYSYSTWLEDEEARSFLAGLSERTTERLMVPVWPAMRKTADFQNLPMKAGVYATFELVEHEVDFETVFLHVGRSPGAGYNLTTESRTVPVAICDFEDGPPAVSDESDETFGLELSFLEDASGAERLSFMAGEFAEGPTNKSWMDLPFGPFVPEVSESPTTSFELFKGREKVGGSGRFAVEHHGDELRRRMSYRMEACDFEEVALVGAFFEELGGMRDAFWLPTGQAVGRLAEREAGDVLEIRLESGGEEIELGDDLALVGMDGFPFAVRVFFEGEVLMSEDAIDDYDAAVTSLQRLVQFRFSEPYLEIVWDTDETASMGLSFAEVLDGDESDGAQETVVSLYEFRVGAEVISRLTSFEREVNFEGSDFVPALLSHSSISAGLELDDTTELRADWRVDPVRELFEGKRLRVKVVIRRVNLATGEVLRAFHGELEKARLEGRTLTATASIFTLDLDTLLPRVRAQRPCNWQLFGEGCGLVEGNFGVTATVSAINGRTVTLQAADDDYEVDHFSYGYIMANGGRKCLIVESLLNDVTVGAGELCPLIEVGEQVYLVPGCDGRATTCKEKFANYSNYGGHQIAEGNLSLVKISKDVGGGKK